MLVRRAFATVTPSQADAALVAGSPGYRYRVLALLLSGAGAATAVTPREKPAGTGVALGPAYACSSAALVVLPQTSNYGWFETVTPGNGLSVNTGAGANVAVLAVYGVIADQAGIDPALVVSKFTVVPATATPTVGVAFNVTVTARNAVGGVVTGYAGTVRLTSSDPAAVLPAAGMLTGGVGVLAVTLNTAGGVILQAQDVPTGASGFALVAAA